MVDTIAPQPQPQQEPVGFGELFDAAARKNFLGKAQEATVDLMTYGAPVEGYKASFEDVDKVSKDFGLTETQKTELSGSLSPEELQYRAQRYQEKNTDKKKLEDAGWKGLSAEILAYAVDPALLPTYAIKTPLVVGKALQAAGIKLARGAVSGVVERAVGASIVGSAVGLGQEAALSIYDTERDVNDVILAGLAGAVGGAAFSSLADGGAALFRKATGRTGAAGVGRAMDEAVESVDWNNNMALINSADHELTGAAMGRIENSAYGKYFDSLSDTIPDPLARKRVLTEGDALNSMIDELVPVAAKRLDRGQRMDLEANIKTAQHNLDEATTRLNRIIDEPPTGSGKALAQARKAHADEVAALRSRVQQEQARAEQMQTELQPHLKGGEYGEAVRDIDRLRNGIIPERLKSKYLDLINEKDAAPAFDEAASHLPPREEPTVMPEKVEEDIVVAREEAEEAAKADTSVGAAETKGAILFTDDEDKIITDTYASVFGTLGKLGADIPIVRSGGSTSIYTRVMAKMKDNNLRGLGALVFNDPHGIKTAPQSTIAFADSTRSRIMHQAVFEEDMNAAAFIKGQGITELTQLGKANAARIEFGRQIALKMNDLTSFAPAVGDDLVTKTAKARAKVYNDSLEMMKRYGVRGFEDVDARASYMPVVYGKNDMLSALDKYGEDSVKEVLIRGYMNGKIPLSNKSAMIVADNTLERFYQRSGSVQEVKPSANISARVQELANELKANNVPDSEIATVLKMLQDKSLDATVSSRAMQSLHPDTKAVATDGLRFVDLMDTSIAGVDKYARDAAALSGFARYGLKSRRQVEDTIGEAFKRHRQQLTELTERYNREVESLAKVDRSRVLPEQIAPAEKFIKDYKRLGDMAKYRKFLDSYERDYYNGVKVAFGDPLEQASGINTALSATGKVVNLQMLGFSGLAQVADLGGVIARVGAGAVFRNLPTTLFHGVRSILPSAKYFMGNNQLSNMADVFGTVSHQDYLFGHKLMNGADYGDAVIGQVSKADKVLDTVGWVQATMSFLRPMQGMIDELSSRSLMTNLVDLSRGKMFTGKVRKNFTEIGKISDESLDSSLAHIVKEMDSGKDIFQAVRTLDPKLRDELGTAIRTVHHSNVNRSYYGELPAFTNSSLGKVFIKLQSFALVAYEKAIQRGFRHDTAGLVAATTWSAGLAYLFIDVDVRAQALKKPESERADYVRRRTEEERLYTVAGRMSQVAMMSTAAQFANLVNPYEDSVMKPFGEYRGVAASGAIGKAVMAAQSGAKLLSGESTDEKADWYKLAGATPLVNTAMGMAILNTL